MKIAIYTLPFKNNYGGVLQGWALQTVLEHMGHQAELLMPYPDFSLHCKWYIKSLIYTKRFILRVLGKSKRPVFFEKEDYYQVCRHIRTFVSENVHVRYYHDLSELSQEGYNMLIAGSDQIWRPKYNKHYHIALEDAFFSFAKNWNVGRMAYAPSFGVDTWEYDEKQTKKCKDLIKLFNLVSVREKSGVKLCKDHFDVEAKHVLDPTMLLEDSDYDTLIGDKAEAIKGELMCYVLDRTPQANKIIQDLSSATGYNVFNANSEYANRDADFSKRILPPIEQWLKSFRDSQFVVTDSFHACVFSILYKKNFVVLVNRKRGASRIESLLGMFGLEDRIIMEDTKIEEIKEIVKTEIDYNKVFSKLNQYRKDSYEFLQKTLNPNV